MSDDIVPPYIRQRIRVAEIFGRYIDAANTMQNSVYAAMLEALCAEVLDTLDPGDEDGEAERI